MLGVTPGKKRRAKEEGREKESKGGGHLSDWKGGEANRNIIVFFSPRRRRGGSERTRSESSRVFFYECSFSPIGRYRTHSTAIAPRVQYNSTLSSGNIDSWQYLHPVIFQVFSAAAALAQREEGGGHVKPIAAVNGPLLFSPYGPSARLCFPPYLNLFSSPSSSNDRAAHIASGKKGGFLPPYP